VAGCPSLTLYVVDLGRPPGEITRLAVGPYAVRPVLDADPADLPQVVPAGEG